MIKIGIVIQYNFVLTNFRESLRKLFIKAEGSIYDFQGIFSSNLKVVLNKVGFHIQF